MSDMDDKVWSKFPEELVDPVLAFLPMPVLCRFRTVCKGWNSLITRTEFGARRIQHPKRDGRVIVLRVKQGYWFLDLRARRWYTITHDQPEIFKVRRTGSVATTGGLVCQLLCANRTYSAAMFVSNPITKTSTRLPTCPAIATSIMPQLSMIVDNVAHTYKIFLMPTRGFPPVVALDSTTNVWRDISYPRMSPLGRSMILHDGLLYIMLLDFSVEPRFCAYVLWAYNHVDNTLKKAPCNMEFPILFFDPVELVVSDRRLFLASWMRPDAGYTVGGPAYETWSQDGWLYYILEVSFGEKPLTNVFEMTDAIVWHLGSVEVTAIGCGQSIVLASASSGNAVVFDLSTSLWKWEMLPACPLVSAHGGNYITNSYSWYGSTPMSLTLPQWNLQHL